MCVGHHCVCVCVGHHCVCMCVGHHCVCWSSLCVWVALLLMLKMLDEMTYTRAVIKEVLRYRPPAPMVCGAYPCFVSDCLQVPQLAMADVQLTPEYTVPKGSFLSSLFCSILQERLCVRQSGVPATRGSQTQIRSTQSA